MVEEVEAAFNEYTLKLSSRWIKRNLAPSCEYYRAIRQGNTKLFIEKEEMLPQIDKIQEYIALQERSNLFAE
jgi:hypothetical protein